MLKVGLTGNYGMGKSTVSAMFKNLGAVIISSDGIVASLLQEAPVKARLGKIVGAGLIGPDGGIDKKYMASRIFHDSSLRTKVENVLHPLVLLKIDETLRKIRNRGHIVIVEVPLLFEGGYQGQFDRTITVFTDRTTALSRLSRSGVRRKDALARLRSQMDIRTKKRLADHCIDNSGTMRQTGAQVRRLYQQFAEDVTGKLSRGRRLS